MKPGERIAIRNAETGAVLFSEVVAVEYARINGGERYGIVFGESIRSERDIPPGSVLITEDDGIEGVNWFGDLDDDCTGFMGGILLRAEEMDNGRWWWAATELFGAGTEIGSSNESIDTVPSGRSARDLAEQCARCRLANKPEASKRRDTNA